MAYIKDEPAMRLHAEHAGNILRLVNTLFKLADELEFKKGDSERRLPDPVADWFYRNVVFMGRDCITPLNPFPAEFKWQCEGALECEIGRNDPSLFHWYYIYKQRGMPQPYEDYRDRHMEDGDHPYLSDDGSHTLSKNDISVLVKVRNNLVNVMRRSISICKDCNVGTQDMEDELNRYEEITRGIKDFL